ncbi:MAG: PQQ-binding-like beta-propeller repeat protein, partial [Chitinivibrionales bacterium]|nr:PQQ-binding-like beta-propeller repeat protein [Chitinivibrionales bacterium]MBD3395862.1 PQQ-binding-like beta-propeller repeat protein [Chitinivibrionales bacterium]
ADPAGNSFYVPYTGNLDKRSCSDGSVVWSEAVSNISLTADMMVLNDQVFVATTDGDVEKRDAGDGTLEATFEAGASVELPLLGDGQMIYVTPKSSKVYKVDVSTMDTVWEKDIGKVNTGPAFMGFTGQPAQRTGILYAAAEDSVYRITDNGSSATIDWTYWAGDTVSSGPIEYDGVLYFGREGGRYYAVEDNGTSGDLVNKWPYVGASGNADTGPWIDRGNSRAIFATTGGDLEAFELE